MGSLRTAFPISALLTFLLGLGVPLILPHGAAWVGWVFIALAALILVFWLGILVAGRLTRQESAGIGHHISNSTVYINQITPELAALNPSSVVVGGSTPSIVVARPDAAPPQPVRSILGTLSATEQSDTAAAIGTVRGITPLYVGQVIISAAQLAEGSLEIAIRVFNGSDKIIALDSVHGAIFAGIHNANGARLPSPTLRPDHSVPPIPPGTEFMVILDQPIPGHLSGQYLRAMENPDEFIAFDFRSLEVRMRAENDANVSAALPLWQGATIRRRDDIFTGRMYLATLTGQVLTASVGAVGVGE